MVDNNSNEKRVKIMDNEKLVKALETENLTDPSDSCRWLVMGYYVEALKEGQTPAQALAELVLSFGGWVRSEYPGHYYYTAPDSFVVIEASSPLTLVEKGCQLLIWDFNQQTKTTAAQILKSGIEDYLDSVMDYWIEELDDYLDRRIVEMHSFRSY